MNCPRTQLYSSLTLFNWVFSREAEMVAFSDNFVIFQTIFSAIKFYCQDAHIAWQALSPALGLILPPMALPASLASCQFGDNATSALPPFRLGFVCTYLPFPSFLFFFFWQQFWLFGLPFLCSDNCKLNCEPQGVVKLWKISYKTCKFKVELQKDTYNPVVRFSLSAWIQLHRTFLSSKSTSQLV